MYFLLATIFQQMI